MSDTSTISSVVDHRVGFHFSCISHLRLRQPEQCDTLQIHYVFPPDLLVDPYELDLHHNTYTYHLRTHPDLELPVFATEDGQTLLNINVSTHSLTQDSLSLSLPFHARYGWPSRQDDPDAAYESIRLPQPTASWLCTSLAGRLHTRPVQLNATIPDIAIFVPLGVSRDQDFVELSTVAVVLCLFVYISWVFIVAARRITRQEQEEKIK